MPKGIWLNRNFCFVKYKCKCGCNNIVPLYKKYFSKYELYGYPRFIPGHHIRVKHPKINPVQGDFCYIIKCYCNCPCHHEIKLSKKHFKIYEKKGYPEYIHGHNTKLKEWKDEWSIRLKNKPSLHKGHRTSEINKLKLAERTRGKKRSARSIKKQIETKKKKFELLKIQEGWKEKQFEKLEKQRKMYKQRGRYSLNPIIGNGIKLIRGYDRHHVNLNDVIYVPNDYNQGIIHNVRTGYNMEIVNTMAYFFLLMNYATELKIFFEKI